MRFLTLLVFLLATSGFTNSGTANAQVVQYKYSGIIPTGASGNSMVADGELFTAIFDIDTSITDSDTDSDEGIYIGAVLSGSLSFSGGYVSDDDFSGLNVTVADNFFGQDGILVAPTQSTSRWFSVATQDLLTLPSDAMPPVGTSFLSDHDSGALAFGYSDAFGGISYTWNSGSVTSFSVTSVPEPVHATLLAGFLVMLAGKRRRRL